MDKEIGTERGVTDTLVTKIDPVAMHSNNRAK